MSYELILGDTIEKMREMPSKSVHEIVTSPPYWGLRNYGTNPQIWAGDLPLCENGEHEWLDATARRVYSEKTTHAESSIIGNTASKAQDSRINASQGETCSKCGAWRGELGLEPTPELYVKHLVDIFREARRVLRDDGTLWLNLGDSYNGSGGAGGDYNEGGLREGQPRYDGRNVKSLKPKDLVGIPFMVAFALRQDGWYLRSDIIWHKTNPMPESVTDRPTRSHEYIFLLTKSARYYYDADAIREEGAIAAGTKGAKGSIERYMTEGVNSRPPEYKTYDGYRNKRSVWTVTTKPYEGAHFATFPEDLIEPCILAGTSEYGVCDKCGAPYERIVVKERSVPSTAAYRMVARSDHPHQSGHLARPPNGAGYSIKSQSWQQSCDCEHSTPVPATVMDIFNGAGTAGLVALKNSRNYIGIELNPEYLELARERLDNWRGSIGQIPKRIAPNVTIAPLFTT